jgi:hypothetical protein
MPRERWLEKRKDEILPLNYFHVVFTLPHELNTIILNNKKVMLNCLFTAASKTLLTFAKNQLNGTPGFLAILHTWDQKLNAHFHLHRLVAGGVVSNNNKRFISSTGDYLFNQQALSLVFHGKFIQQMSRLCQNEKIKLAADAYKRLKNTLFTKQWIVSVRDPVNRPEHVLEYLARYTHRVAIANSRIKMFKDGRMTFTAKDRKKTAPSRSPSARLSLSEGFCFTAYPRALSESGIMAFWPTVTERLT